MSNQPPILSVEFDAIPQELRERPQWVTWRSERRKGGWTKPPYQPDGRPASTDDPATWNTFVNVSGAYGTRAIVGIGYVFSSDDPYTGVDLDKCRDPATGTLAPWAQAILRRLNSYCETSPSGTGVKLILLGRLPRDADGKTRHKLTGLGADTKGVIELYDERRFFTITGHRLQDYPETIEPRQEALTALHAEMFPPHQASQPPAPPTFPYLDDAAIIEKARAARNGGDFVALWNGDTSRHDGDDSRADLSLCCHLAFWAGGDPNAIDRLFRKSRLCREKWTEREDYRTLTISRALSTTREFYRPADTPSPALTDRLLLASTWFGETLKARGEGWPQAPTTSDEPELEEIEL